MKLSSFIAGAFGIVGFVLSVFAGLGVGNSFDSVLWRGLFWAAVCYVVGYIVGLIAQQVAAEHAQHVAKLVAEQDARDQAVQAEEAAKAEEEAAVAPAVSGAGAPPAATG